jgi:hypothetical protein
VSGRCKTLPPSPARRTNSKGLLNFIKPQSKYTGGYQNKTTHKTFPKGGLLKTKTHKHFFKGYLFSIICKNFSLQTKNNFLGRKFIVARCGFS